MSREGGGGQYRRRSRQANSTRLSRPSRGGGPRTPQPPSRGPEQGDPWMKSAAPGRETFAEFQSRQLRERAQAQDAFLREAQRRGQLASDTPRTTGSFAPEVPPQAGAWRPEAVAGLPSKRPPRARAAPPDMRAMVRAQYEEVKRAEDAELAAHRAVLAAQHREEHQVSVQQLVEMLHLKIVERTRRASDQYREAFRIFGAPVERIRFPEFQREMRLLGLIATTADLRRLFDYLDEDGSGDIDFGEMVSHVMPPDIGYNPWAVHEAYKSQGAYIVKAMTMDIPDVADLPSLFSKVELTLGDFTGLIQRKLLSRIRVSKDCYREAFRYFGCPMGGMDFKTFHEKIDMLGIVVPENVLRALFRQFDTDGGGTIDFTELIRNVINYTPPAMRRAKPAKWDPTQGKFVWAGKRGNWDDHSSDHGRHAEALLADGDAQNKEWELDWRRQVLDRHETLDDARRRSVAGVDPAAQRARAMAVKAHVGDLAHVGPAKPPTHGQLVRGGAVVGDGAAAGERDPILGVAAERRQSAVAAAAQPEGGAAERPSTSRGPGSRRPASARPSPSSPQHSAAQPSARGGRDRDSGSPPARVGGTARSRARPTTAAPRSHHQRRQRRGSSRGGDAHAAAHVPRLVIGRNGRVVNAAARRRGLEAQPVGAANLRIPVGSDAARAVQAVAARSAGPAAADGALKRIGGDGRPVPHATKRLVLASTAQYSRSVRGLRVGTVPRRPATATR